MNAALRRSIACGDEVGWDRAARSGENATSKSGRPLLWVQSLDSRRDVLVCPVCAKCLGDVSFQLNFAAGRADPSHLTVGAVKTTEGDSDGEAASLICLPVGLLPESGANKESNPDLDSSTMSEEAPVLCRLGCGLMYCSSQCHDVHHVLGHSTMCVGPHGEDHPFYQFTLLALQSGSYEELSLAAKFAVMAANAADSRAEKNMANLPSDVCEALKLAHATWSFCVSQKETRPWYEITSPDASEEEAQEWRAIAKEVLGDAWNLLLRGSSSPFLQSHSLLDFSRVMTTICRERIAGTIHTPLKKYVQQLGTSSLALRRTLQSQIAEASRARILLGEEELEGLEEGEEEEEEEEEEGGGGDVSNELETEGKKEEAAPIQLSDEILANKAFADPATYVAPPLQFVALLPGTFQIESSCIPNTNTQFEISTRETANGQDTPSIVCRLVAACDIPSGKAMTICKIDALSSLEERQEQYVLSGQTECECARCRFEKTGYLESLEEIVDVVKAAQRQERYGDALVALAAALKRTPRDGQLLYLQSRISGWDDQWTEARRLLQCASVLAPEHDEISKKLRESDMYFAGKSRERVGVKFDEPTVTIHIPGGAISAPDAISRANCALIIEEVEAYAANSGGWTTKRHYSVPTTDIPVHDVPTVLHIFNQALSDFIYPLLANQFGAEASRLRVIDAFIVKYRAGAQTFLPLHVDQSMYSLTIALNDTCDYEGGGTFFAESGIVVNCDAGGVIGFRGDLLHGGHPTFKGQRYIIVAFLYEESVAGEKSTIEMDLGDNSGSIVQWLSGLGLTDFNTAAKVLKKLSWTELADMGIPSHGFSSADQFSFLGVKLSSDCKKLAAALQARLQAVPKCPETSESAPSARPLFEEISPGWSAEEVSSWLADLGITGDLKRRDGNKVTGDDLSSCFENIPHCISPGDRLKYLTNAEDCTVKQIINVLSKSRLELDEK